MSMLELPLPRALATAVTVSLVVLVAQWLPVSANGGDPLIDILGSVRFTLDERGISLGLQSTDEVFGNLNGGRAQGAADARLGQLAADQEFTITRYGAWFINSAFGWPTLPTICLQLRLCIGSRCC